MSNHHAEPNLTAKLTPSKIMSWNDPPASAEVQHRTRSSYRGVVADLMANPGRWAQLDDRTSRSGAYQFAKSVAAGRSAAFRPEGAFDAAWEGCSVWVRYVGVPDEAPARVMPEGDDPADEEAPAHGYIEAPESVNRPDPEKLFSF